MASTAGTSRALRTTALLVSPARYTRLGPLQYCCILPSSTFSRRNLSHSRNLRRDRGLPQREDRPTVSQIFSAAWRSNIQLLRQALHAQGMKQVFRQSPEETVLAVLSLVAAAVMIVFVVWAYFRYFQAPQFTRFPKPVAESLRKALYFSNVDPDIQKALRYYKQALRQCEELRMDPLSEEVTGVKIQLAAWFEKIGSYDNAIKVLDALLGDLRSWVASVDSANPRAGEALLEPEPSQAEASQAAGEPTVSETLFGKRTRILAQAIGVSSKLGELLSDEHVAKPAQAHERLLWAVNTALGELRRRSVEGLRDGEGDWMSSEAMGGAIEALGHSYESRSQFELAGPLFLQALRLCQDPCHSAVLMNNLAASVAQLPKQISYQIALGGAAAADVPVAPPSPSGTSSATADTNLDAARRWAQNALQHAREPQGEDRKPDCDQACAVALCNLGDFALMAGDRDEARRRFREGITLARAVHFPEAVQQAERGLRRASEEAAG